MALSLNGTSNGSLNNLSLTANTGTILDSANTTFFGADVWRLASNLTSPITNGTVLTDVERADDAFYGKVGTGMTVSSGIFTFPTTGIYLVFAKLEIQITTADTQCQFYTMVTQDNSSYTLAARALSGDGTSSAVVSSGCSFALVDVTDVSNVKVRFEVDSTTLSGKVILGASNQNRTSFYFTRLGDT